MNLSEPAAMISLGCLLVVSTWGLPSVSAPSVSAQGPGVSAQGPGVSAQGPGGGPAPAGGGQRNMHNQFGGRMANDARINKGGIGVPNDQRVGNISDATNIAQMMLANFDADASGSLDLAELQSALDALQRMMMMRNQGNLAGQMQGNQGMPQTRRGAMMQARQQTQAIGQDAGRNAGGNGRRRNNR